MRGVPLSSKSDEVWPPVSHALLPCQAGGGGSQSLRENRRAAGEIEEKREERRETRAERRETREERLLKTEMQERSEKEERNQESREALEK